MYLCPQSFSSYSDQVLMTELGFCHHPTIPPTNLSLPTKVWNSSNQAAPYHFLSAQVWGDDINKRIGFPLKRRLHACRVSDCSLEERLERQKQG
jgi:hypothetical protein